MKMVRKKTNQTVTQSSVKKATVKRTSKSQPVVPLVQEEPIIEIMHQEQEPTTIIQEETHVTTHVHEETVVHEEINVSHEHEHDSELVDTQKGILASIMAFKAQNEIQFYGIVAIAVFIVIIIL